MKHCIQYKHCSTGWISKVQMTQIHLVVLIQSAESSQCQRNPQHSYACVCVRVHVTSIWNHLLRVPVSHNGHVTGRMICFLNEAAPVSSC